jgi:hypothetical protein
MGVDVQIGLDVPGAFQFVRKFLMLLIVLGVSDHTSVCAVAMSVAFKECT